MKCSYFQNKYKYDNIYNKFKKIAEHQATLNETLLLTF
jgi:hypothetical protein